MRPTVFIIGAGPGAPDLITVRGLRALQSAQVVIHDSRIHPRLLALAPATAERIDVGSAAPQAAEQDAINLLIAEKARDGQVVARLKWGDPFVFDRGGPEALFLHEQGVPFEVIPGVPVLLPRRPSPGIPLSYPGAGDTITFVRGLEDEGRTPPSTDWARARRPRRHPRLLHRAAADAGHRRIAAGRTADPPTETAAFMQHGTLSSQQTITAPLGEIRGARPGSRGSTAPGVLVIGSGRRLP